MTQCSATSVVNQAVSELSWILFRAACRGGPSTEGDQGPPGTPAPQAAACTSAYRRAEQRDRQQLQAVASLSRALRMEVPPVWELAQIGRPEDRDLDQHSRVSPSSENCNSHHSFDGSMTMWWMEPKILFFGPEGSKHEHPSHNYEAEQHSCSNNSESQQLLRFSGNPEL